MALIKGVKIKEEPLDEDTDGNPHAISIECNPLDILKYEQDSDGDYDEHDGTNYTRTNYNIDTNGDNNIGGGSVVNNSELIFPHNQHFLANLIMCPVPMCRNAFVSEEQLLAHLIQIHYECPICHKRFMMDYTLIAHMKSDHNCDDPNKVDLKGNINGYKKNKKIKTEPDVEPTVMKTRGRRKTYVEEEEEEDDEDDEYSSSGIDDDEIEEESDDDDDEEEEDSDSEEGDDSANDEEEEEEEKPKKKKPPPVTKQAKVKADPADRLKQIQRKLAIRVSQPKKSKNEDEWSDPDWPEKEEAPQPNNVQLRRSTRARTKVERINYS